MEEKKKIQLRNDFESLSDITNYYYNEFKKLRIASDNDWLKKRKQKKKTESYITTLFFKDLELYKSRIKTETEADKKEIKVFKKDVSYEYQETSLYNTLIKPFKAIVNKTKELFKIKTPSKAEILPIDYKNNKQIENKSERPEQTDKPEDKGEFD